MTSAATNQWKTDVFTCEKPREGNQANQPGCVKRCLPDHRVQRALIALLRGRRKHPRLVGIGPAQEALALPLLRGHLGRPGCPERAFRSATGRTREPLRRLREQGVAGPGAAGHQPARRQAHPAGRGRPDDEGAVEEVFRSLEGPAQGAVKISATNTAGFKLDEVRLAVPQAFLGPLRVEDLLFEYQSVNDRWRGEANLRIPALDIFASPKAPGGLPDYGFQLAGGELAGGGFGVGFPVPPRPQLFPGIGPRKLVARSAPGRCASSASS